MRREGRLRAVSCSPRTASGVDWRTAVERAAAAAAGVHVLRTFAARLERFDVHPGIQGGGTDIRRTFDCAHSALAPGAYDAEVHALARILDKEGDSDGKGRQRRLRCREQPGPNERRD